jgi:hypothetical protein
MGILIFGWRGHEVIHEPQDTTPGCDDDPGDVMNASLAHRILAEHAHRSWEPCLPRLAALAYLGEDDE